MMTSPTESRQLVARRAFTLVELLVVITIITILASTTVFALFGVREDARERRARAQIAKINELIMDRWESYLTRALPMRIPPGTNPRVAAALRLNAVRELMRMELPDRITDLHLRNAAGDWVPTTSVGNPEPFFRITPVGLESPPSAWLGYQRRMIANAALGNTWTEQHEHSECLYMILAGIRDGDTTALEWFHESEIGDTDGDGMFEILDPWGKPIYFLRWAPGYVSDLQDPRRREPDPFDPLRVDPRWENNNDTDANTKLDDPFALYPLVYSAGRDREYGVVRKDYDASTIPPTDVEIVYGDSHKEPYASAVPDPAKPELYPFDPTEFPPPPWPSPSGIWATRPMNDPYLVLPTSRDYVGRIFITNNFADDDITNHLLEVR